MDNCFFLMHLGVKMFSFIKNYLLSFKTTVSFLFLLFCKVFLLVVFLNFLFFYITIFIYRMLLKFAFTAAADLIQEANNFSLLQLLGCCKKEKECEMDFILLLPEEVSLMILE